MVKYKLKLLWVCGAWFDPPLVLNLVPTTKSCCHIPVQESRELPPWWERFEAILLKGTRHQFKGILKQACQLLRDVTCSGRVTFKLRAWSVWVISSLLNLLNAKNKANNCLNNRRRAENGTVPLTGSCTMASFTYLYKNVRPLDARRCHYEVVH